ncbi:MAG: hypothetical protein QOJ65_986 [Fimbriimonadaceae bacterium]|nr:hypothetical protein [Fimbriimonadaceae bacterium]
MEKGSTPVDRRYLTDEQIVGLYRAATTREQAHNSFELLVADRQFVAGFWDFLVYSFLIVVWGLAGTAVWIPVAVLLFLGRWTPIGPISLVHRLSHPPDPDQKPLAEQVNPHSITVMRTVAESLANPLLGSAWSVEGHLAVKKEVLECLLEETETLCRDLRQSRLEAGELEGVFDTKLAEARLTASDLKEELAGLEKTVWHIRTEVAPLEAYLAKLGELERHGQRLTGIRSRMAALLERSVDSLGQQEFQQLPLRLEQARQNLRAVGVSLEAYDKALLEMRQVTEPSKRNEPV